MEIAEEVTVEDVIHALPDAVAKAKGTADDADEVKDDDAEKDPEPIASSKNMRAALEVLSRGRRQHDLDIDDFEKVLENFRNMPRVKFPPRQTRMTSFFGKIQEI